MKMLLIPAVLVGTVVCGLGAELSDARQLLEANQPAKAGALVRQLTRENPGDPWLNYDVAVTAYAARDYAQADYIWQQLATRQLPSKLRDKVWMQIGNVCFRKGEAFEKTQPELALPDWEQSREAYKVVLASQPRDKITAYNLKVVELKLAKLHAQLAQRLLQEAKNQNLDKTIEKLQAAVDHQRTAQNLDPQNEQYQQDVKKTEQQLAEKFNEKAKREEAKADKTLENQAPSQWERRQAEKNLETALTDFREAKALNPENREAQQGEKRVMDKLAKLLTQEGKQLQNEAKQTESYHPENAIDKYEQALEKYEEALQLNENNPQAKQGEQEVKQALEQLHMKQGDKMAQEGRQDAPQQPAKAAEEMMSGLQHYEQAQEVNPQNTEAQPKIDALEKELPPLLNALGRREQERAAQEENKSLEKAVAHLEKAATSYEMAQQIDEQNQEAQQQGQQVQKNLARLRDRIAQRAQQQQQQQQQQPQQEDQYAENFQTMLSRVKSDDKQKEYEEARRAPTTQYTPDQNRIFKNW